MIQGSDKGAQSTVQVGGGALSVSCSREQLGRVLSGAPLSKQMLKIAQRCVCFCEGPEGGDSFPLLSPHALESKGSAKQILC